MPHFLASEPESIKPVLPHGLLQKPASVPLLPFSPACSLEQEASSQPEHCLCSRTCLGSYTPPSLASKVFLGLVLYALTTPYNT